MAFTVVVIAIFVFFSKEEEVRVENKPVVIKKEKKITPPKIPTKIIPEKKVDEALKAPIPTAFEKKKSELTQRFDKLNEKLSKCQNEVDALIDEEKIRDIENRFWDLQEKKNFTNQQREKLEVEIFEAIGGLTSIDWHMEELGSLIREVMDEQVGLVEPKWTLDIGAKARPCGVFRTHRLLALWMEMLPPKAQNDAEKNKFVEESVTEYIQKILNSGLGGPAVSMQLELLVGMIDKDYFDPSFKERLNDLDQRLNEELDAPFQGDDQERELVKSVVREFNESDHIRRDLLDLLTQRLPR